MNKAFFLSKLLTLAVAGEQGDFNDGVVAGQYSAVFNRFEFGSLLPHVADCTIDSFVFHQPDGFRGRQVFVPGNLNLGLYIKLCGEC